MVRRSHPDPRRGPALPLRLVSYRREARSSARLRLARPPGRRIDPRGPLEPAGRSTKRIVGTGRREGPHAEQCLHPLPRSVRRDRRIHQWDHHQVMLTDRCRPSPWVPHPSPNTMVPLVRQSLAVVSCSSVTSRTALELTTDATRSSAGTTARSGPACASPQQQPDFEQTRCAAGTACTLVERSS